MHRARPACLLSATPYLLPLILSMAFPALGAETSLFRHDFEAPGQEALWTGWSVDQPVAIERHSPGYESDTCLRFSVDKQHWDTAIIIFAPPLKVSADSYIRFQIKADRAGGYGLNVRDATEGAEYYIAFNLVDNRWTTVQRRLGDATYKRFGKPDSARDGVAGDELESLQIAYLGNEMCIDNFEILDSTEKLPDLPDDGLEPEGGYELRDYPCLREVFPFGVITTVAAGDDANATFFGQTKQERFEDDVTDLKLHGMNVLSNFCDDGDVRWRLGLMDRYHMYIIETLLANSTLTGLPADDPLCSTVREVSPDPHLLAWYGRDEPSDYRAYLANKLAINALDEDSPVASAFNEMWAAKMLGPFMEMAMLDHYSVLPGEPAIAPLAYHADLIRDGRRLTAGGKIWFITQTFSNRHGTGFSLRMPTVEEIRFDTFNSIAAGVSGMLYFIYNDTCSYLDGQFRGEEFDDTLVDPWGNPHPVYEELSRIAQTVLPIMPSFLDAKEPVDGALRTDAPADRLTVGQLQGEGGTLVVAVNKSLTERYQGQLGIEVAEGQQAYDPLAPDKPGATGSIAVDIDPGGAALLILATPAQWQATRRDIIARGYRERWEQADVRAKLLAEAGLPVSGIIEALAGLDPETMHPGPDRAGELLDALTDQLDRLERDTAPYWEAKQTLQRVREKFGEVHRAIRPVVTTVDATTDPAWQSLLSDLRTLSVTYFDARRKLRHGEYPAVEELSALQQRVDELKEKVVERAGV